MAAKHAVVIGAGIVGLCVAEALVKRGLRVTVIEREPLPGTGCSYINGGLIVPSHFIPIACPSMLVAGLRMMRDRKSPFGVERLTDPHVIGWMLRFARCATKAHVERAAPLLRDLNLESRRLYEELLNEMGAETGYARRGLLMLCRTQAAYHAEEELSDHANRLGLKTRSLNLQELADQEPDVEMDVFGALHFEDDAHLSPSAFMHALRRHLVAQGVQMMDGCAVTGFRDGAGRLEVVQTSAGDVDADEFVLAAGAWTSELSKQLRLRLPLIAGRGWGFTSTNPPQRPTIPAILTEARVAVTPVPEGVHFVGTMELARPEAAAESPRVGQMRRSIGEYYPNFKPEHLNGTAHSGLRPCSPDGLPYVGRLQSLDNVVIATGHAMMGMSLGPVTGKLVAQVVLGEKPSLPLKALSPLRFA